MKATRSMNRSIVAVGVVLVLILAILVLGILLYSKENQLSKSRSSEAKLNAQTSSLAKQNATLSQQLSKANQSISSLSQNGTYVVGAPCQTGQLSLATEGHTIGAAGNRYQLLSYQNTSNTACTVKGFPGFLALDSSGHVVPNGPINTGGTPTELPLSSNDKAYFVLHWPADGMYPNEQCINTSLIESTPPENIYPVVATIAIEDLCGPSGMDVSALGSASQYSYAMTP